MIALLKYQAISLYFGNSLSILSLSSIIETDDFIKRLWDIHLKVKHEPKDKVIKHFQLIVIF